MIDFDIARQVSHIEANRVLKDGAVAALKQHSPRRRISVTDLTSLKQAYFRRKCPEIVPSLEKQQVMWSGTGFHELFGAAVSSEEYLEQTVEMEGVVGKIDIFEDIPVEVKTTRRLGEEADLARRRPSYVEQLGMYCAMTGKSQGRIIVYQREEEQSPLLVYHVSFSNLQSIAREMAARREALEAALSSDDPSRLPSCPWGDRGCDYSAVCDCKTNRVRESYAIRDQLATMDIDALAARQLLDKLNETASRHSGKRLRITDLVFPRKAFLERRQQGAAGDDEQEGRSQLSAMGQWGILSQVREAFLSAPGSEARKMPVNLGALSDMVQLHQGKPAITRLMQLGSVVPRERLPQFSPHYFARLGFDCALAGERSGRMLLYYPRIQAEDAKLMVYDVAFKDISALKSEAAARVKLLENAQRLADLPACPEWMCRRCAASPECQPGIQKNLF